MIQTVEQVRPNAMTSVEVKAFADECKVKSVADLNKQLTDERKSLTETMQLASRTMEDGEVIYDFSKSEQFKDLTEADRRKAFAEKNDRLNVLGAVISEKTFYNNLSNTLANVGDHRGEPLYTPEQVDGIVSANQNRTPHLSLSDMFEAQPEWKAGIADVPAVNRKGKGVNMKDLDGMDFLNAVFQRTGVNDSGWEPQIVRSGRIVYASLRPDQLVDFLPRVQAMNGGYSWVQETALTAENASNRVPRERAEGAAAEQLTLEVTDKTVKVEKLPCYIPVTEEQLEDEPGARAYLEMRLPQQVLQRLDYQALNGNGTSPNMQGFATVSGINTIAAASGAKILDQAILAAEAVWNDTYRMINLFAVPFKEYRKILTAKDTDGNYLYGDPSQMAFMDRSIWGFRMVCNDAIAANTAYAFDITEKLMIVGRGIEVVYGYVGDDFIRNRVSIRCSLRANFADLRPTSTCKITALNNAS